MATERQILANQQNALKSTGPKTDEGKDKSCRNALQHGLTGAGKVMRRGDDRRLRKTLKAWREHLQPIDVLEDCLVAQAAVATVRLRRCRKKDLADLARRKHRATRRWEVRQQKARDASVELLGTEPGKAVEQLEANSFGCDWMIERWRELAGALEEPGFWDDRQAALAVRMLGKDPDTAPMNDSSLTRLRLAILAVTPDLDPDDADAFFEESTAELDPQARKEGLSKRLPDPETGRIMLFEIAQDEIARLEPLSQQLWEDQNEPERQEAEDVSLVDTTLAGARALRYENAHEMSLHRSVNLLIRLRKIESEQQTYDRWAKMRKPQGRYWDGKNWVFLGPQGVDPCGPPGGPGTDAPDAGSDLRNEPKSADTKNYSESIYNACMAGAPKANVSGSEVANPIGSEVSAPAPGNAAPCEPAAASERLRNEANSSGSSGCPENTLRRSATGVTERNQHCLGGGCGAAGRLRRSLIARQSRTGGLRRVGCLRRDAGLARLARARRPMVDALGPGDGDAATCLL
jgi:hypothetical protein